MQILGHLPAKKSLSADNDLQLYEWSRHYLSMTLNISVGSQSIARARSFYIIHFVIRSRWNAGKS
jgi:hypothetical protein